MCLLVVLCFVQYCLTVCNEYIIYDMKCFAKYSKILIMFGEFGKNPIPSVVLPKIGQDLIGECLSYKAYICLKYGTANAVSVLCRVDP